MKYLPKLALLGVVLCGLAACGGGYTSKVEGLVESCWVPGMKARMGLADIKVSEIQVTEEKLSDADKQNGFTWAASVLIKFTYRETASGPWQDSIRLPAASVREGKLRMNRGVENIECQTDA